MQILNNDDWMDHVVSAELIHKELDIEIVDTPLAEKLYSAAHEKKDGVFAISGAKIMHELIYFRSMLGEQDKEFWRIDCYVREVEDELLYGPEHVKTDNLLKEFTYTRSITLVDQRAAWKVYAELQMLTNGF